MDDFSRFILAWALQHDMTADSLIEVVQEAVDKTVGNQHKLDTLAVEKKTDLLEVIQAN
jgi:hypothetical protein